ncbi:hypothetical protein Nazgul72 [Burkholderia phage BcepNazgul]|uniref:Uncharacterized protein n=1 Tax=Burkholderia phage BcepNazgul TaxID=242861 RepID=Q6UYG8_9CAUD|nr:hypothetical protein Nazgul72 [Burkholderia phage BcepNazgul]AAQ63373.2 hypothetical protein Nazgul72 [Burkholderia phage BcepNazgul]
MSFENALKEFIKSAVTEAIAEAGGTGGGKAAEGTKATTTAAGKGGGKAATKPKHSADEVKAILIRVKDEKSMDDAKAIIKKYGKAEDLGLDQAGTLRRHVRRGREGARRRRGRRRRRRQRRPVISSRRAAKKPGSSGLHFERHWRVHRQAFPASTVHHTMSVPLKMNNFSGAST